MDHRRHSHDLAQPDLDFLAPECGLTEKLVPASDIFSLGVLIYAIYNLGQPPFSNTDWTIYTVTMSKVN